MFELNLHLPIERFELSLLAVLLPQLHAKLLHDHIHLLALTQVQKKLIHPGLCDLLLLAVITVGLSVVGAIVRLLPFKLLLKTEVSEVMCLL